MHKVLFTFAGCFLAFALYAAGTGKTPAEIEKATQAVELKGGESWHFKGVQKRAETDCDCECDREPDRDIDNGFPEYAR